LATGADSEASRAAQGSVLLADLVTLGMLPVPVLMEPLSQFPPTVFDRLISK